MSYFVLPSLLFSFSRIITSLRGERELVFQLSITRNLFLFVGASFYCVTPCVFHISSLYQLILFFSIYPLSISCRYTLKPPRRGAYHEYTQRTDKVMKYEQCMFFCVFVFVNMFFSVKLHLILIAISTNHSGKSRNTRNCKQ